MEKLEWVFRIPSTSGRRPRNNAPKFAEEAIFGYFPNPGFQDEALSCRLLIQWPRYLHSSLPFPQRVKMVVEPPIPCSVSRQSWLSRCDSEWTRDMEQSSGRDPEGIWDKEGKKERRKGRKRKMRRVQEKKIILGKTCRNIYSDVSMSSCRFRKAKER